MILTNVNKRSAVKFATLASALFLLAAYVFPVAEALSNGAVYSANCPCPGPQGTPPVWSHAQFLDALNSLNWAGYVVASDFSSPQATVTSATGSWVVQTVAPSKRPVYSTQWVGIGGFFSGDNSLIQTGTSSNSANGNTNYFAWYELLPASETPLGNSFPVSAGDNMGATVSTSGGNSWTITLTDVSATPSWTFTTTVTYASSMKSAEWIEERPAIAGSLTTLANFGTAEYGQVYTSVSGTSYATIGGSTLPIGSLSHQSITMVSSPGKLLAKPSALSNDGTSFTVVYK